MERRMVLAAAAASAASVISRTASAADPTTASPASPDLAAALARFRAAIPSHFDRTYVENAVVPFFLTSVYEGERPALPMIDVTLTKENALPHDLCTIGESFNTVLAFRDVTQPIVYDNYMTVRALLDFLKTWIDERLDDITSARIANPERTIAWYWLKNAGDGTHFSKKDVVFECFHNFVAFSQWGNTIFGIMSRLSQDGGDPDIRAAFEKTMSGNPDDASGAPYTPLEMFVMELFRTISPNGGSISSISDTRQAGSSDNYGDSVSPYVRFGLPYERNGYIISPHTSTSFDPRHWSNPRQFDPGRYRDVPTSAEVDEARSKQVGFAKCPFDLTTMKVNDGRNAAMANSAFGTVFGVVDGKPLPVCDYAGFAPFGFGYRRCPGEQLTIQVFEDFLRKVWRDKITFRSLNLPNPRRVPIGPNAVIEDNITFARPS